MNIAQIGTVGTTRTFKMNRLGRVIIAATILLILGVAILFLLQTGPRPVCHKALEGALQQWVIDIGKTNVYPNVNGDAAASLGEVDQYWGPDHISQFYGYLPGLRFDDSRDLVLMYLKQPTAYTWHGDHDHNIFSSRKWMVLSPDMVFSGTCPEGGDLLDTPEFKKRLLATIDFLKTNNRPNWQVVAKEQMEFLASIK